MYDGYCFWKEYLLWDIFYYVFVGCELIGYWELVLEVFRWCLFFEKVLKIFWI